MTDEPQKTPPPGSATATRQGTITGRVVLVLGVSLVLVVVGMVVAFYYW